MIQNLIGTHVPKGHLNLLSDHVCDQKAIIVPIKKPNSHPALAKNYCTISLIRPLSKLIEHIYFKRVINYLPNIPQQFGFSPQLFTKHQILRVVARCIQPCIRKLWTSWISISWCKTIIWHQSLITAWAN